MSLLLSQPFAPAIPFLYVYLPVLQHLESSRTVVAGQAMQEVYLFLASVFSSDSSSTPPPDHAAMLQRLNVRARQQLGVVAKPRGSSSGIAH